MTQISDRHSMPDGTAPEWWLTHLEDAQRASGLGSWELEIATGRVWMTEMTHRIFDFEPGTIHTLDEFLAALPPQRRPVFRAALDVCIRDGTPLAYDAPAYQRDGSIRWTRGKGAVKLDENGRLTHLLGTVIDVTELKLAQDEVASKQAALEAANAALVEQAAQLSVQSEDLQRLDRLKDDFLSMLSHELRTPLTTIQGSLDLLERHPEGHGDSRITAYHRRIQAATHTLNTLVADLLSAAQLRHGGFMLRRSPLVPAELLSEALDEVTPLAEAKGLMLALEALPTLPTVVGDRTRLVQVLRNLLLNAIRHTPEDGEVSVRAEADGDELRIRVADTGDGLSDAARERLFERFAVGGPGEGIGLGLFIVKELVEAHGGRVSVESARHVGTTFTLALPL